MDVGAPFFGVTLPTFGLVPVVGGGVTGGCGTAAVGLVFGFDFAVASSGISEVAGFGFGLLFAVGAGVGVASGAGVARGPKMRFSSGRESLLFSVFGFSVFSAFSGFSAFSDGATSRGAGWPDGVLPRCAWSGRASDVRSSVAKSLRMGLVGNEREIVFQGRRLSSLSSISATDEAPAMLRSWVEVDLAAIRRNAATLSALAGPAVKIMAVVKANAYGHGAAGVVDALAGKVALFGVANLAEAEEIFPHAGGRPICLLSGTLPAEHAAIVRRGFIPVVSSFEEAAQFATHAPQASGGRVNVHLSVDTGMGRLGVWQEDAIAVARKIMALPGIAITGIGSHLPVADEDPDFTREQLARFHGLVARLRDIGLGDALAHVENSAGLLAFPNVAGTLARPGLALYGESPLPEFQAQLTPALTWKTRVLVVRDFGKGRGVSYGREFITPAPMRIATLAVGYADGYPRQLSAKNAAVLIGGKRCVILGRVTMDQIMADVTGVDASPGDEAVLIGTQGGETIPVRELATLAGTIVWDIFTGIGQRVARLHRDGDASAFKNSNPA